MSNNSSSSRETRSNKGYISEIEIENFKSYKGKNRIGPFKKFSAVIGPNGSGKSNLIEAISFVLGLKTQQLRGKLIELLHKPTQENNNKEINKGHVKLVFTAMVNKEVSEIIEFKREIIGQSNLQSCISIYKINEEQVTSELYEETWKKYGILVKARNFLVFQGDIESMATLSPKELSKLFEEISGSISLSKDYDEALKRKQEAERNMTQVAMKKRNIVAEKKLKKNQRNEAVKYLELVSRLEEERRKYYTWKLNYINNEISVSNEDIKKLDDDLKVKLNAYETIKNEEIKRNEQIEMIMMELVQIEKHLYKEQIKEEEMMQMTILKLKEEKKRLDKRVEEMGRAMEREIERREEWKSMLKKAKMDKKNFEDVKRVHEEVLERQKDELELDSEDMKEYEKIKKEVMIECGQLIQERNGLEIQQSIDEEALKRKKDILDKIKEDIRINENEVISELEREREGKKEEMEEIKNEIKEKKKERNEISERFGREEALRNGLYLRIRDREDELKEAKACYRESRRDKKIKEAILKLKEMKCVYGSVTDLSKVREPKYKIAMTVALGYHLNSVIVDTEDTGKECIAYLKEQRYPPLTFIPLKNIQCKKLNEKFRELGGSAKLIIDIIEFNEMLYNAFLYVCGNTVICDSYEEAKMLSYEKKINTKVVCLNGTMIHKNGMITGGMSENVEMRASRWDDEKIRKLNEELNEIEKEYKSLPPIRELQLKEQQLIGDINCKEEKMKFLEREVEMIKNKINDKHQSIDVNNVKMKELTPKIDECMNVIGERQKELDKIISEIKKIRNKKFEEFNRRKGIDNYEEYEEEYNKKIEESLKQKREIENQLEQIKRQIDYESSRDMERPIVRIEQKIQQYKIREEEINQQIQSLLTSKELIGIEIEKNKHLIETMKEKEIVYKDELEKFKNDARTTNQDIHHIKRNIDTKKNAIQTFQEQENDIIKIASIELGGSEFQPDNSLLGRKLESMMSEEEKERTEMAFKDEIFRLVRQIETSNPNLKAFDQFKQLEEQDESFGKIVKQCIQEESDAKQHYNEIYLKRHDLFMKAFNHISKAVDKIYKDLTVSELHPYGGSAEMFVENDEEPFLHGIKYVVIPPSKRYREMETLSGGEKSLVALSLLFSIQEYQPSPFFILDEVDASLDAENVSKVAEYIHEKTCKDSFQSIVISLKDTLYSRADCLIGIAKDHINGHSEIFTLDLEKYD